jgi:hypothetical protein
MVRMRRRRQALLIGGEGGDRARRSAICPMSAICALILDQPV